MRKEAGEGIIKNHAQCASLIIRKKGKSWACPYHGILYQEMTEKELYINSTMGIHTIKGDKEDLEKIFEGIADNLIKSISETEKRTISFTEAEENI